MGHIIVFLIIMFIRIRKHRDADDHDDHDDHDDEDQIEAMLVEHVDDHLVIFSFGCFEFPS